MTPVEIVAKAHLEASLWKGAWGQANYVERSDAIFKAQAVLDALTAAGWRPPIEVPESVKDAMGRGLSEWSGIRDRDIEEAVELALEGLAGGGFVVVPVDATEAMRAAWERTQSPRAAWSAMIAASQSTEQQP